MTEWASQPEAARLLGVDGSAVAKMVARGDLTPGDHRPSLSHDQVLKLRQARATAAAERERRRTTPPVDPRRPDDEHVWLPAQAAAAMWGCSVVAVRARAWTLWT